MPMLRVRHALSGSLLLEIASQDRHLEQVPPLSVSARTKELGDGSPLLRLKELLEAKYGAPRGSKISGWVLG